jgi:hypothetical protein
MLFALPGYQFPYTVMNRCLYLPAMDECGGIVKPFHSFGVKKLVNKLEQ